jgi:hypothetical protein
MKSRLIKCKFNIIHLGRYNLIEACNRLIKTELSEALP